MRTTISAVDRFWAKVQRAGPDDCWQWQAGISSTGYGQFHPSKDEQCTAHSFSYRLAYGQVPIGLVIDHECHNRDPTCVGVRKGCMHKRCVNPSHLILRTNQANLQASPRFNGKKTHCPKGHPYSAENTVFQVRPTTISRRCRACSRIADRTPRRVNQQRERRARAKEARNGG